MTKTLGCRKRYLENASARTSSFKAEYALAVSESDLDFHFYKSFAARRASFALRSALRTDLDLRGRKRFGRGPWKGFFSIWGSYTSNSRSLGFAGLPFGISWEPKWNATALGVRVVRGRLNTRRTLVVDLFTPALQILAVVPRERYLAL